MIQMNDKETELGWNGGRAGWSALFCIQERKIYTFEAVWDIL
jgi:hypothetical protein